MREIGEARPGEAARARDRRGMRRVHPEAVALGLLTLGGALGLMLWSKWGPLIALQSAVLYCF